MKRYVVFSLAICIFAVGCEKSEHESYITKEKLLGPTEPTGEFMSGDDQIIIGKKSKADLATLNYAVSPTCNPKVFSDHYKTGTNLNLVHNVVGTDGEIYRSKSKTVITGLVSDRTELQAVVSFSSPMKASIEKTCRANGESPICEDGDTVVDPKELKEFAKTARSRVKAADCFVAAPSEDKISQSTDVGTYQFKSGRKVKALKFESTTAGTVFCIINGKSKKLGLGEHKTITIMSRDVPSANFSTCSSMGELIFSRNQIKTKDGKLRSGNYIELLSTK